MTRMLADIPRPQRSSYDECPDCGCAKAKHAALCRECAPTMRGTAHPSWKGDEASDVKKRKRAANVRVWAPCEICGEKGVDRHHRDGDPGNNVPENIQVLCRRCHMEADGRLAKLTENARSRAGKLSPRPCSNCSRPTDHPRLGRCPACYAFTRRTGRDRQAVPA